MTTIRKTGTDGKDYDISVTMQPATIVASSDGLSAAVKQGTFSVDSISPVAPPPPPPPPPVTAPTISKWLTTPGQNLQFSDGSAYNVQTAGKSYSMTQVDSRTIRFELHQGDRAWFDTTPDRAELSGVNVTAPGGTISTSFDMMVEPGPVSTAQWLLFAEIHNADGVSGVSTSPPVALEMSAGDFLQVVMRYCPKGMVPSSANVKTQTLWRSTSPIVRGSFHNVKIVAVNDNSAAGSLSVTIDGNQVVNYHGPVAYSAPIYFEEGIYRHAAPEIIAAQFRNLQVTT